MEEQPEVLAAALDIGAVLDLGSLTVGAIDFGEVAPDAAPSESFSFSNLSEDPEALLVINVSIDGDGYSVTAESLNLNPGESGSFDLSFSAADVANANGSYPGVLTILTNDPDNQETVILLAAAIVAGLDEAIFVLSDDAIAFGSQVLDTSTTETFTITNAGGLPLEVTLALAGDDVFTISSEAETLLEGESADIEVVFTPGASIAYSATVTITTDDVAIPEATVALSGIGAAPGRPRLALSDNAIAFGAIVVGGSSSETLTIMNTGGADLTSSIALAGDAVFTLDIGGVEVLAGGSQDLADLAPGGSLDVTAVFTPGATIDYTGTITITSNDVDATVALSGSGEAAPVGPVCRTALDADGGTLVGFLDDDDDVDLSDFFKFADAFGKGLGDTGYDVCADFNEDGNINLFDFFQFADSFGKEPVEFL